MDSDGNSVRVLHLITRFLGGGAETTTENTIHALSEANEAYDIRLGFGYEYDEARAANIESDGIETTAFRFIRHYNPIAAAVAVAEVARYLSREDIHVLHTHSTEAGIIGRLAARIAGTPIVIHEIHGDPIAGNRNKALNEAIGWLERFCATMTTCIVVKSERIRECYLDRGVGRASQYELIYHGVEIDAFRKATRATDVGNDSETTLLFVGRLNEGKGLFDLIDAFESLVEEYSVELLIAGKGPLAEPLRSEIATRGLDEHVRLLGYRTDIPAVMNSSDVFILPSYREGTPRAITEALSTGLPVISTDIAGIPDQVDHGRSGYLIQPGDIRELRERIATLLSDSDLRMAMGEHASGDVQMFDAESKRCEYRELYRALLNRGTAAG
jgi:glycosyltransferase involved in cell wall biosynthesis